MIDPVVVLAATARGWAAALRSHAADHGGVVVRATVLTPEDALAEQCDVVLLDDVTSFLTPTFVTSLQSTGRAVLGIYDHGDAQGKSDLVDAGVDALVPADSAPEDLLAQVARLAARRPEDRPAARPVAAAPPRTAGARTVGVAGPSGGVGVTEIAIELAAAAASRGRVTALVDADEVAPGHAQRLGLPIHPNLHTALRAVELGRSPDGCLHPLAARRPLVSLVGMAVTEDWAAVPSPAPTRLLAALGLERDVIVTDLGHCLPPVEGLAGLRYGHAQALAAGCDDLVLVTAPTPQAVTRTIALAAQLPGGPRRRHVVLNRAGADKYVRDECVAELRRATGVATVHVVAEDPRVQRAAWQGTRVGRGRFQQQVAELAAALGMG